MIDILRLFIENQRFLPVILRLKNNPKDTSNNVLEVWNLAQRNLNKSIYDSSHKLFETVTVMAVEEVLY